MSDSKRRLTERITDADYLAGIETKPIEELRSMREECREAENEVSFGRRLCQARMDILSAELARRESGAGDQDLLSRLPEILGGEERPTADTDVPLPSRAPDFSTPRSADVPRRRVEEIVGEQTLARLRDLSEEEIRRIVRSLGDYEAELSSLRKRIHEVMDGVQAEIVRRYSTGEADPAAVLGT